MATLRGQAICKGRSGQCGRGRSLLAQSGLAGRARPGPHQPLPQRGTHATTTQRVAHAHHHPCAAQDEPVKKRRRSSAGAASSNDRGGPTGDAGRGGGEGSGGGRGGRGRGSRGRKSDTMTAATRKLPPFEPLCPLEALVTWRAKLDALPDDAEVSLGQENRNTVWVRTALHRHRSGIYTARLLA